MSAAKKVVIFGEDIIEQYKQTITKDDFNSAKKRGIARVTLENQEKRAEDAEKREAFIEVIRQKHSPEDQSNDTGLSLKRKSSLRRRSTMQRMKGTKKTKNHPTIQDPITATNFDQSISKN